jgi:hypothetical protein
MADDRPSLLSKMTGLATPRKNPKMPHHHQLSLNINHNRMEVCYFKAHIRILQTGLAQTTKKKRILVLKSLRVSFIFIISILPLLVHSG